MLRTPQFYVLYLMMLMVGIGGLMATAQVAPVARNFKVGATALSIALSLNPLGNGVSRFLWGCVSDSLGRERTMALAFFAAGGVPGQRDCARTSRRCLVRRDDGPGLFDLGRVVRVVPGGTGRYVRRPSRRFELQLPLQHEGSGFGPGGGLAAQLFEKTGSWNYAFYGSAVLALCSALGAIGLLRMPLPKKRSTACDNVTAVGASATSPLR